jgi:hypothetical protein
VAPGRAARGATNTDTSTAGAAGSAEDRDAIRRLHLAFVARLEHQSAHALASIPRLGTHSRSASFNTSQLSGEGVDAPANLFGEQGDVQLGAYRQTTSQQHDQVSFSEDGLRATATFHCEVELCSPLQADCTAAQMARMQGLMASRRWESGRFEASYKKARGQWQMTAVRYIRA